MASVDAGPFATAGDVTLVLSNVTGLHIITVVCANYASDYQVDFKCNENSNNTIEI